MEKSSLTSSAADHTGNPKGHSMPPSIGTEEKKPLRKRPPHSLQLSIKKFEEHTSEEKPAVSPIGLKVRSKSSPLIEKLQANLALAPTALLHSPKSPDVSHSPTPFSPGSAPAHSPLAPPSPALVSEEQAPVSFEDPPEGAVLPSINKGRVRLSLKRRPPTRQLRKSCSEEEGAAGGPSSPCPPGPRRGGEGEDERTDRKDQGVRERKCSGRDSGGEGGAGTPEADEDKQETAAVAQEARREGLGGEPCSGDGATANPEEERVTQEEEEGENVVGLDEVKIEFSVK